MDRNRETSPASARKFAITSSTSSNPARYSAGRFRSDAIHAVEDIPRRARLPSAARCCTTALVAD
jgi:hypothetical protein